MCQLIGGNPLMIKINFIISMIADSQKNQKLPHKEI